MGGVGRIQAGDGGTGGEGWGDQQSWRVISDTDGMVIKAGNGGAGLAGKSGGIGADISNVYVSGFSDGTANNVIQILAGNGGDLAANTGGKGGNGGKATNIFVGYDKSGSTRHLQLVFSAIISKSLRAKVATGRLAALVEL